MKLERKFIFKINQREGGELSTVDGLSKGKENENFIPFLLYFCRCVSPSHSLLKREKEEERAIRDKGQKGLLDC